MSTWIKDNRGNKCSVEYFGSKEAAQKALDSLINCDNCTNCSRCSGCSGCSRCSGCSNITYLYEKKDTKGDPDSKFKFGGPPPIPVIENIHKKVYEATTIPPDALDMSTWHTCGTTHCRGGWVVHLAGDAGYALEAYHNTLLAAQLIYSASGYEINPCRFYDNNKEALADMKRLAEAD